MKVSGIMSHIVTIETRYKNVEMIQETCKRLGIFMEKGSYKFTFGGTVEGYKVYLKKWFEPVVITEDGELVYDDMYDKYTDNKELSKFKNTYCLIETERLLKKQNLKYKVYEQDEEIKIEVIA